MNYVVSLKNGTALEVSEKAGVRIEERWNQFLSNKLPAGVAPSATVKPVGQDLAATIHYVTINGVYPEPIWANMLHEKNGDWICNPAGTWHKKGESCNCSRPNPQRFVDQPTLQGTVPQEKWDQAKRNLATLHRTGKYGTEGISQAEADRITAEVNERRAKRKAVADLYAPRRVSILSAAQQAKLEALQAGNEL